MKSNFLHEDDLNWKIIEASLSTLTLNDEDICFNSEECLVELTWIFFFYLRKIFKPDENFWQYY